MQKEREAQLKESAAQLIREEREIETLLSHIEYDEERMLEIKRSDRKQYAIERSREIERKRRLLTKEEGRRTGNPPLKLVTPMTFTQSGAKVSSGAGWPGALRAGTALQVVKPVLSSNQRCVVSLEGYVWPRKRGMALHKRT